MGTETGVNRWLEPIVLKTCRPREQWGLDGPRELQESHVYVSYSIVDLLLKGDKNAPPSPD